MEKIKKLFDGIGFNNIAIPQTRLLYVKNMSPRHPYFADCLEIGKAFLECVLTKKPSIEFGDIYFVYPERWMNFVECRQFRRNLETYPEVYTIKSVSIITSSLEIIASYDRDQTQSLEYYF